MKFERNVARDGEACAALHELGWTVLIVWECELKNEAELENRLRDRLGLADSENVPGRARQLSTVGVRAG